MTTGFPGRRYLSSSPLLSSLSSSVLIIFLSDPTFSSIVLPLHMLSPLDEKNNNKIKKEAATEGGKEGSWAGGD